MPLLPRMTPAEKRQARRTALLGLLLTLLVITFDVVGLLRPIDNALYDFRARTCQFFAPPPSDDLVYVDIDDQSLDAIGEFPWPRDTLAAIVDEIHSAGAKTIAFDIIFDKPQPKADMALAEACKKFDHALLPVSFELDTTGIAAAPRNLVLNILKEDLELNPQQVVKALRDRGNTSPDLESRVQREFPEAFRDAMYDRVVEKVGPEEVPDPVKLRPLLLPRISPAIIDSYRLKQLSAQCERLKAERMFRRFERKRAPDDPPLLPARRVMPPVSVLGGVSSSTGYVDYVVSDGVVRTLPLFIQYKDGLYPQAGLSLACAILNLDPANPDQVQLDSSAVTLHPAGRPPIRIPTRHIASSTARRGGGAFMEVPWYGESDWADMYARFNKKPHVLINDIWQLCQSRRALINNNLQADECIKIILSTLSPERLDKFRAAPPAPDDFRT
jgi:hypothetical protein